MPPCTLGLLSDFNVQNFGVLLKKSASGVRCFTAPYGQTLPLLLDRTAEFWRHPCDALVIWTFPHLVVPSFRRAASFERFSITELMGEVDSFCALVSQVPENIRTVIIPSWTALGFGHSLGPLELAKDLGGTNLLMQMNLRMAERLDRDRRVVLLDAERWLRASGPSAYNPRLWYLSKTPFSNSTFQEASQDVIAAIDGIHGRTKKLVVLDLDNTLWGGVVGEVGWQKLRLGGHDPVGEALVDFQKGLKRLASRGVLLAIVSKNEESVALEAIRSHPEMVLRVEDFAAWRINWNDKAENVRELISSLNLGLDSAVFFDDTAFERARVRDALPQVLVPDMPADPIEYPFFLESLRCFHQAFLSDEDRGRTAMYAAERERSALKQEVHSLSRWLEMLGLKVTPEALNESNLDRATQLFNKTNQMNLSTRRLTADELLHWSRLDGNRLWTVRVSDKFGEYGLCGICSVRKEGTRGRLTDFLLSCRVMGRGVEETMLAIAARQAQDVGCQDLIAEFVPTGKNQPCEKWFLGHPELETEGPLFRFSLMKSWNFPAHAQVVCEANREEASLSTGR